MRSHTRPRTQNVPDQDFCFGFLAAIQYTPNCTSSGRQFLFSMWGRLQPAAGL